MRPQEESKFLAGGIGDLVLLARKPLTPEMRHPLMLLQMANELFQAGAITGSSRLVDIE